MRKMKNIIRFSAIAAVIIGASACTDLNETVYDQVMTNNYYNTKADIIQAVFRPFEHVYCSEYDFYEHEELTGDHFITPTRGTWWYDGGNGRYSTATTGAALKTVGAGPENGMHATPASDSATSYLTTFQGSTRQSSLLRKRNSKLSKVSSAR